MVILSVSIVINKFFKKTSKKVLITVVNKTISWFSIDILIKILFKKLLILQSTCVYKKCFALTFFLLIVNQCKPKIKHQNKLFRKVKYFKVNLVKYDF